ncbi:putative quinol monooxygenase [Nannocystis pusilla]|uniref:putative quinol monooxygenase n=1 Tax=Nannocystis pusilla TaxID=889268 RepID=UPI003B7AE941
MSGIFALGLLGCSSSGAAPHAAGARYAEIPSGAYAVTAQVRAKQGKEDDLRAVTLPLVEQVRNEPNNLVYFLHENREAPGHFIFYEIFATKADFEAHNATPHVKAWFAKLPELADGGVDVLRAELLGNQSTASK